MWHAQQGVPEGVNFFFEQITLVGDLFSCARDTNIAHYRFVAALFDITIGVTYGIIFGWFGGRVNTVIQRFLEIISAIKT